MCTNLNAFQAMAIYKMCTNLNAFQAMAIYKMCTNLNAFQAMAIYKNLSDDKNVPRIEPTPLQEQEHHHHPGVPAASPSNATRTVAMDTKSPAGSDSTEKKE